MNSVSDNYHFLCFGTITQVKVISGHQGKKVKQKNQDFQSINQSVYSKPSTVWLLGFQVRYSPQQLLPSTCGRPVWGT